MDVQKTLEGFNQGLGKLTRELPRVMKGFRDLHEATISDGALSAKQKELIAVGIGVAIRCHYCIAVHVAKALELGATREEIVEAISVAILMGGGPAAAYATEALQVLDSLTGKS
ncbi:alkylhydroperoxidase AhpD family core domain-containing protein [Desulfofundulus australicus DSM 11792]|uniref:Alkylhydroperoxidase AhpD family core domain-containing protein n=1 Tax=Desulfofundulus australicus DSM 11792 TaxID=1121425 RepID=A0A1M4WAN0_9FIRM|nr:carboxymuconolactone decarboxylase family protein [Desulfofundulus australicus]SHE78225.1 alkylhydroperoxidase AhpD family core domain-containing protein [Desulfofundulus australicus DSM 11792]